MTGDRWPKHTVGFAVLNPLVQQAILFIRIARDASTRQILYIVPPASAERQNVINLERPTPITAIAAFARRQDGQPIGR